MSPSPQSDVDQLSWYEDKYMNNKIQLPPTRRSNKVSFVWEQTGTSGWAKGRRQGSRDLPRELLSPWRPLDTCDPMSGQRTELSEINLLRQSVKHFNCSVKLVLRVKLTSPSVFPGQLGVRTKHARWEISIQGHFGKETFWLLRILLGIFWPINQVFRIYNFTFLIIRALSRCAMLRSLSGIETISRSPAGLIYLLLSGNLSLSQIEINVPH